MRDEAAAAAAAGRGFLTDLQRMVLNAAVEERNSSTTTPEPPAAPLPATPAPAPASASADTGTATATATASSTGIGTGSGTSGPVPAQRALVHHPSAPVRSGSKGEGHASRGLAAGAKVESAAAKSAPAPLGNKQERKSHTGLNGRPKKGGGGGKGTWGDPMDPNNYVQDDLDPGDPLYDADEGLEYSVPPAPSPQAQTVEGYKARVGSLVDEYFLNGDLGDAGEGLGLLGSEEYHHHFVKRLVYAAMDRHDKEKEMAAQLLAALYGTVIVPSQIAKGFSSALAGVDDLRLDCPEAVGTLAIFLARAVVDDILPPVFLTRAAKECAPGSGAAEAVAQAEMKLKGRHSAELLEKVWVGEGGLRVTAEVARGKVRELLREYVASGDVSEALRCVRDLNMPFFHHEVVKCALVMAMESKGPGQERLLALLHEGTREGLLSSLQLDKGFARVLSGIDDLALDIPGAPAALRVFLVKGLNLGWLTPHFIKQVAALSSRAPAAAAQGGDAGLEASQMLREFKAKCRVIVAEYFLSGDAGEAARCLEELAFPDLLHHFVKGLVSMALDRKNREREMASLLLSALYEDVIPSDQVESGFLLLLESVEDLALDIPNAPHFVALFLARAVVDDVLAPHFVSHLAALGSTSADASQGAEEAGGEGPGAGESAGEGTPSSGGAGVPEPEGQETAPPVASGVGASGVALAAGAAGGEEGAPPAGASAEASSASSLAREVARMALAMLSARHAAERLLRCWGGSSSVVVAGAGTGTSTVSGAGAGANAGAGGTASGAEGAVGAPGADPAGGAEGAEAAPGLAADAKEKIVRMLEEYVAGGTLVEACQCLRDLNLPFFHHEVVKKAVTMALEKRSGRPLDILREAGAEDLITAIQVEMGLRRLEASLEDLSLDVPDARSQLGPLLAQGKRDGWVPETFQPSA